MSTSKDQNFYRWAPQSSEADYFAVFLRETQSISKLAGDFGVEEGDLSVQHKFQGQALGGQVFWVKPKAGVAWKPSVFANSCYVVTQCRSDREFRAPYRNPQPFDTEGFLDKSWYPPKPRFTSITGGQVDVKNHCCYLPNYGEFEWDDDKNATDSDAIVIRGSWKRENIISVAIPQLKVIKGGGGVVSFNLRAASQLKMLWQAWEDCGFLSKVVNFAGGFVPRYQRKCNHLAISNHAFGTAFDINDQENPRGYQPAPLGQYGCVREMVEVANRYGFYWGGHWVGNRCDGMHFEVAKGM